MHGIWNTFFFKHDHKDNDKYNKHKNKTPRPQFNPKNKRYKVSYYSFMYHSSKQKHMSWCFIIHNHGSMQHLN